MPPLSTPPCSGVFRWATLFLLLGPWDVHAAAPTVEVNGTSIIGTSQTSTDNVTVEFFGGEYPHACGTQCGNAITDLFCAWRDPICPATCRSATLRVTRGDRQPRGVDVQRYRFRRALRAARCTSFVFSGNLGDAEGTRLGRWCFRRLSDSERLSPVRVTPLQRDACTSGALDLRRWFRRWCRVGLYCEQHHCAERSEGEFL